MAVWLCSPWPDFLGLHCLPVLWNRYYYYYFAGAKVRYTLSSLTAVKQLVSDWPYVDPGSPDSTSRGLPPTPHCWSEFPSIASFSIHLFRLSVIHASLHSSSCIIPVQVLWSFLFLKEYGACGPRASSYNVLKPTPHFLWGPIEV